jgi:hypothetical protein
MKLHAISLLIALFIGFGTYAQVDKKTQLEQQKNDNLVKIKELNSIISKTSKKKKVSIGKLNVLKEQIVVQKKQINILNENQSGNATVPGSTTTTTSGLPTTRPTVPENNDILSTIGKAATGALTATGTNLLKSGITKDLNNIVKPSVVPKTPTPVTKNVPAGALAQVAAKPAAMSAQQMLALQSANKKAAQNIYVPPKKMDVSKLTPLKSISGLTALLRKG